MNKPRKGAVQRRTEKKLFGLKKQFFIGKEEVFI
jgi:hypothetical protein